MVSEERLAHIFRKVASDYGYSTVSADYIKDPQPKIYWERSQDWINFHITDYLRDAPEDVLFDLADTLCTKIFDDPYAEYGSIFYNWITGDSYAAQNQAVYIRRNDGIDGPSTELEDSYNRLRREGHIGAMKPNARLVWMEDCTPHTDNTSCLVRAGMINSAFRDGRLANDPDALDFAVLRSLSKMNTDWSRGRGYDEQELTESLLERYPEYDEAYSRIVGAGLRNKKAKNILFRRIRK